MPLALSLKVLFCHSSDRQSAGYKDMLATLLITIVFDLKSNGTKGLVETSVERISLGTR